MQFLYSDGTDFNFMDPVTFEQMPISAETVGVGPSGSRKMTRSACCTLVRSHLHRASDVRRALEVTETEPGFKGDTVQGSTKPATLETGATIQVPMFVNIGDVLQVDTRDGRFIKRM